MNEGYTAFLFLDKYKMPTVSVHAGYTNKSSKHRGVYEGQKLFSHTSGSWEVQDEGDGRFGVW